MSGTVDQGLQANLMYNKSPQILVIASRRPVPLGGHLATPSGRGAGEGAGKGHTAAERLTPPQRTATPTGDQRCHMYISHPSRCEGYRRLNKNTHTHTHTILKGRSKAL